MTLAELNALDETAAKDAFTRCCGASRFVLAMLAARPFPSTDALFTASERASDALAQGDWLEAFRHHPKIGDVGSLRAKFASTAQWAAGEQAGAASATDEILRGLAEGNATYEAKFGFIFIVCATGKTAREMLDLLSARIPNDPMAELTIAAAEQRKITKLRLEKLLS